MDLNAATPKMAVLRYFRYLVAFIRGLRIVLCASEGKIAGARNKNSAGS